MLVAIDDRNECGCFLDHSLLVKILGSLVGQNKKEKNALD